MDTKEFLNSIKYDSNGLVPVIAQDCHSKKVRMLAYMDEEAIRLTLETKKVYYYSRSRQKLWLKGETSGNFQYLKSISIDCDGDTLLMQIEQEGGISCHTGHSTCFFQEAELNDTKSESTENCDCSSKCKENSESENSQSNNMLSDLQAVILDRKLHPKEGSYTNYLFDKGLNKILKKVGEESSEVIIAAKDNNQNDICAEIADLMYHVTVLMTEKGIDWSMVGQELAKRK